MCSREFRRRLLVNMLFALAYLLSPVLHCVQSTADSITVAWVDLDQLMASWKLKVYTEDSDTAFLVILVGGIGLLYDFSFWSRKTSQ